MADTTIEWATKVWNCTRGCSRVSPGCGGARGEGGCYAERQAYRFSGPGQPYEGLVRLGTQGPRWTGKMMLAVGKLRDPLSWRKQERIFVNSMSDLFHEDLTDEAIDCVFGTMWACLYLGKYAFQGHIFQILTKRAERMRDYMSQDRREKWAYAAVHVGGGRNPDALWDQTAFYKGPHPRIWLGVSVENQKYADDRIPVLLQTPAAVRWISAEPLLGPIDLGCFLREHSCDEWPNADQHGCVAHPFSPLSWVVIGGESGPGARPFDLTWGRSLLSQCRAAGIPAFFKQTGALVVDSDRLCGVFAPDDRRSIAASAALKRADNPPNLVLLSGGNKKGGELGSLPSDLRVREFPEVQS